MDSVRSIAVTGAPLYSLWQLVAYMLRLGFGGPVVPCGYMHRDLVDVREWISDADYKEGLALVQLMPGPLAAQLAMYLGYVHYRTIGATLTGVAFVLPSFFMVLAIGWAYVKYGGLPWMQAVFYGVGAAVIGIIAISAYKPTKRTVGKDKVLWLIYVALTAVTAITESESGWLFILAGLIALAVRAPPRWLQRGGLSSLVSIHAPAGLGLAIVPFLYAGVVTEHHWLTERQFVDAVAVAMITSAAGSAGAGGDNGGFHRVPHPRVARRVCRRACHVFALLPLYRYPGALLQALREVAVASCVCGRRHRSNDWRYYGRGVRARETVDRLRSHRHPRGHHAAAAMEIPETAGARHRRRAPSSGSSCIHCCMVNSHVAKPSAHEYQARHRNY